MDEVWEIINHIGQEPLLLWTAAVLSVFLLVGILKRVLSIIVSCAILIILYLVYLTYFEEEFPLPEADVGEWIKIGENWFDSEPEPILDDNQTASE
ncbi:MAG: hypothetical protein VCA18_02425 [Opitutales bacterium]|jgi:hypothetical protein